jgi:hypothetical protein
MPEVRYESMGTLDPSNKKEVQRELDNTHRYSRCRGGHFNPDDDQSLSPLTAGPPGLQPSHPSRIRAAVLQAPINTTRYSGESNPWLLLWDYKVTC